MDDTTQVLRPDERDLPGGAAALAKGLYLLDVIGERHPPARFKDLQAATGLPKGTLARMLNTLVAYRLVRHEKSDSTYRLGHRLFELAHRVWDDFDLRSASSSMLDRLADEARETAALCVMEGDEVLYVDQRARGGAFGFRIEVGRRAPLHCTAGGKALLAFAPPHEHESLLQRLTLAPFTDRTHVSSEALQSDLALARVRGYAISMAEHVDGVSSVAAPIFDHTGKAIAAIGVFGPSSRLAVERLHVTGRDLMAAARMISGNVGAPVSINSLRAPKRSARDPVECILAAGAQLAEGPVWSEREHALYWVDILAPSINRFDPGPRVNTERVLPRLVSAVAERVGGGMIAVTQNGLESFDFDSGTLAPLCDPEADRPENRFNDAKCDRAGRLWVGSMNLDSAKATGALYQISPDRSVTQLDTGFTVSNGLDWSPDGRIFYFTDSAAGRIFAYEYDPGSRRLGARKVFAEIPAGAGRPDGLAVDSEGGVWCAIWDGWAVRRYAPDGRLLREVSLPVPRPTSVAFGVADLKTLFITSARLRLPAAILAEAPFSGGLFTLKVETPGQVAGKFGG